MSKPKITLDYEKHKEVYKSFRKDYLRICRELKARAITSRQYDKYNNYICRSVLCRELNKSFNQIVSASGLTPFRHFITIEESKKLNEDILKLRLEEKTYLEISEFLDIDLSLQSIMRRLKKIYDNSPEEIKLKLDAVKQRTKKGRYWQVCD